MSHSKLTPIMSNASGASPFVSRRVVLIAIVAAIANAGCTTGPDYHPPALPDVVAGSFVTKPADTDIAAPLPAHWWKLYNDPALDQLVQLALSANTNLRVTLANLDRARGVYKEARGGLYPSTSLSAGPSYGRDQTTWTGSGQAPTQLSYNGGIDISYEVDLFGRVRRDVEAARDNAEAVAAAHDAAKVVVVADTTKAYLDACNYGESMQVAQASIALAQRSLDLVRRQEHAGAASLLDVERAGVILAQAQAALPPLQNQRETALFELAVLMGRTPSQVPESARACIKAPEVAGALPIGDGTALLRRRPDLRQAERQLAADTARIGVAVADLYPRVTLGASASYLRDDALSGNRTWSYSLGPLISWSFPNTMVVRSRIAQAKAQAAASLASFDGVVLNALKESEQSLSAYGAAMQQRQALIDARDRADKAFQLADQRYRAGSISYLDVIVAQTSLIDAKSQVASADQRVGSAQVSVFKALGGGWE